jgi:hypothetical protein
MSNLNKLFGKNRNKFGVLLFLILFFTGAFFIQMVLAAPSGPRNVTLITNETESPSPAYELNISGGYIATINITAVVQNVRWKAFVGNLTGKFTLDDSSGSTIYDWTIATPTGRVYATRNSSTISWTGVNCSTNATLELENYRMNHTNPNDNLTITFRSRTHPSFFVGTTPIAANSCPTLNTYVNNASQSSYFYEEALVDSGNATIFTTNLEAARTGFDGGKYDFQMIVPENGAPGFTGTTPYYLYAELI